MKSNDIHKFINYDTLKINLQYLSNILNYTLIRVVYLFIFFVWPNLMLKMSMETPDISTSYHN